MWLTFLNQDCTEVPVYNVLTVIHECWPFGLLVNWCVTVNACLCLNWDSLFKWVCHSTCPVKMARTVQSLQDTAPISSKGQVDFWKVSAGAAGAQQGLGHYYPIWWTIPLEVRNEGYPAESRTHPCSQELADTSLGAIAHPRPSFRNLVQAHIERLGICSGVVFISWPLEPVVVESSSGQSISQKHVSHKANL